MTSNRSSTNLREQMEATVRAFMSAFEEGAVQQDASIINRDVTADCTRNMLPASILQAFGLPTDFFFDTVKFQELFAKDIKVLKFRNSIIANLVIDTEGRQAAFTSIAEVHVNSGGQYLAEQAWFLYFNEDGSRVKKVVEFCDKDVVLKMANTAA